MPSTTTNNQFPAPTTMIAASVVLLIVITIAFPTVAQANDPAAGSFRKRTYAGYGCGGSNLFTDPTYLNAACHDHTSAGEKAVSYLANGRTCFRLCKEDIPIKPCGLCFKDGSNYTRWICSGSTVVKRTCNQPGCTGAAACDQDAEVYNTQSVCSSQPTNVTDATTQSCEYAVEFVYSGGSCTSASLAYSTATVCNYCVTDPVSQMPNAPISSHHYTCDYYNGTLPPSPSTTVGVEVTTSTGAMTTTTVTATGSTTAVVTSGPATAGSSLPACSLCVALLAALLLVFAVGVLS